MNSWHRTAASTSWSRNQFIVAFLVFVLWDKFWHFLHQDFWLRITRDRFRTSAEAKHWLAFVQTVQILFSLTSDDCVCLRLFISVPKRLRNFPRRRTKGKRHHKSIPVHSWGDCGWERSGLIRDEVYVLKTRVSAGVEWRVASLVWEQWILLEGHCAVWSHKERLIPHRRHQNRYRCLGAELYVGKSSFL